MLITFVPLPVIFAAKDLAAVDKRAAVRPRVTFKVFPREIVNVSNVATPFFPKSRTYVSKAFVLKDFPQFSQLKSPPLSSLHFFAGISALSSFVGATAGSVTNVGGGGTELF